MRAQKATDLPIRKYKDRGRVRSREQELGLPILALAVLITTFFYTLPLGRYSIGGLRSDFRIYDFAFLAFFLIFGLPNWWKMRNLFRNQSRFYYWAGIFLVVIWFSLGITAFSSGLNKTLPAVLRAFRFTYFFLTSGFIIVLADTPRRHQFLLNIFYLNVLVQTGLAFAQGVGWLPTFWPTYWLVAYGELPVGTLSPHHKQIGIVMLMGIILTLSYFRFTKSIAKRAVLLMCLGPMIVVPIFVGSRTAWLGFITLAIAYLFVYRKQGWAIIIIAAITVAGTFWATRDLIRDPLEEQIQARFVAELEGGDVTALGAGRDNIYLEKIPRGIQSSPWVLIIGSGFQNAAKIIPGATAAHNNYLQAWIELGIFGFLLYIKLLAMILRDLRTVSKSDIGKRETTIVQGVWVFFIALLATMLVGESFWAQYSMFTLSGQILALVAIGIAPLYWTAVTEEQEGNARANRLVSHRRTT